MRRFYDATVPGGYLMISHSENRVVHHHDADFLVDRPHIAVFSFSNCLRPGKGPPAAPQFMVAPEIRNNVIFQTFNLMDPIKFRLKFDVIFCRNVMIYFDQPTKDALVQRFYDATVPGGYLLISKSENLSANSPYRAGTP